MVYVDASEQKDIFYQPDGATAIPGRPVRCLVWAMGRAGQHNGKSEKKLVDKKEQTPGRADGRAFWVSFVLQDVFGMGCIRSAAHDDDGRP